MSLRLQSPSWRGRWYQFLRRTRRLRWPSALLSLALVGWLAPGLIGLWLAVLLVTGGLLPRPWQAAAPPVRRLRSPRSRQWLRQQLVPPPGARVYVLWSEQEWAARCVALPPVPRRSFPIWYVGV